MSDAYQSHDDLRYIKQLGKAAPVEFKAWLELDRMVAREDGAIPRKYRELIAIAVAHTTQCVYCIDLHIAAAKRAGATREEVAEAILLAAALRAGGATAQGGMAMKLFDQE